MEGIGNSVPICTQAVLHCGCPCSLCLLVKRIQALPSMLRRVRVGVDPVQPQEACQLHCVTTCDTVR